MPPLDSRLIDDVIAVLRESLTNIARHATARRVEVDLSVVEGDDPPGEGTTSTWLTLQVSDDGVGIGAADRRSGLANLDRRAQRSGGTMSVVDARPTGTRLRWSVPLGG